MEQLQRQDLRNQRTEACHNSRAGMSHWLLDTAAWQYLPSVQSCGVLQWAMQLVWEAMNGSGRDHGVCIAMRASAIY
jgi:hypothetical protein